MSYTFGFMDNVSYGAADLNKIASRLVTAGIADVFSGGVPYNVSKINDLNKAVTARGVALSSDDHLRVVLSGSVYVVKPGLAFFANGSTLEVTADEVIGVTPGAINYVYLKSNIPLNRNEIIVSTTAPDTVNDDVVLLAEISAVGVITDKRCYATGKLNGYQNNAGTLVKKTITETFDPFSGSPRYIERDHDLETDNIRMIVVHYDRDGDGKYLSAGFINLENNLIVGFGRYYRGVSTYDYAGATTGLYIGNINVYFNPSILQITHVSGTMWRIKYFITAFTGTPHTVSYDMYCF